MYYANKYEQNGQSLLQMQKKLDMYAFTEEACNKISRSLLDKAKDVQLLNSKIEQLEITNCQLKRLLQLEH
jgi:hypothetical protein